jgi:hypothetical protein
MPQQHLRADALGHETQFNVVHQNTPRDIRLEFEGMLYEYALGFTRIYALGGWKGSTEGVYVYRVASLSPSQRLVLIEFLLDKTSMKDLYVVHPDGIAFGYCYENGVPTQKNVEAPTEFDRYGDQYAAGRLRGTSHNGYPDPAPIVRAAPRPPIRGDLDFTSYQLINPITDFVVRWGMFHSSDKEKVRNWVERSDFEGVEKDAIAGFLDRLDQAQR